MWLILLPFTLWAAYSWFSVLLSGIFAFLMFGIDEIGVQIEEPFGWVPPTSSYCVLPVCAFCWGFDCFPTQQNGQHALNRRILPLEAIGATIERNIRELLLRNHEVGDIVQAASDAAGRSPAQDGATGLEHAVPDVATTQALAEEDFGEMTGAAGDAGDAVHFAGSKQELAAGSLISLTASSAGVTTEAGGDSSPTVLASRQGQAGLRRVQFGEATVIEVEGSRAQEGAALPGSPTRFAELNGTTLHTQYSLHRRASLLEVELASGASPDPSPRDAAGGRLSSWLND